MSGFVHGATQRDWLLVTDITGLFGLIFKAQEVQEKMLGAFTCVNM
jgi:hypothetical protein